MDETISNPGGPFELQATKLGALPVVAHFLERMGLRALLARYLPEGDARVQLGAPAAVGVLVCNLCLARAPLYGLAEWARSFPPDLLGLRPDEAELLNDDRVGRALDQSAECLRSGLDIGVDRHATPA